MTMKTILAAALFATTPLAAQGATLIDGSFEIKGAATPATDYCYDGFSSAGRPACAAGAWSGSGLVLSGAAPWGGTTTPDGSFFAIVQGTQALTQTFTADATTLQTLSWIDTNRTNNGGLQSYTVSLSDGIASVDLGTYTSAMGGFVVRSSSPFLLTGGTSYTLTFTGLSTEDRTSFIDSVALGAVPEPMTWGLMLIGFGAVGFAARRRRSTVAA